jgi:hypothetical protein
VSRVVQTAPKGSGPPPEGVQGVRFLPPEVSSLPWAKPPGVPEPLPDTLFEGLHDLCPLVAGLVCQRQCRKLFLFGKHNALLLMPARLSSITSVNSDTNRLFQTAMHYLWNPWTRLVRHGTGSTRPCIE